jgi:hypothetical protein
MSLPAYQKLLTVASLFLLVLSCAAIGQYARKATAQTGSEGPKIIWHVNGPVQDKIVSFVVWRSKDGGVWRQASYDLPNNYYYFTDAAINESGVYTYQLQARLRNNQIITFDWSQQNTNTIIASCGNGRCDFSAPAQPSSAEMMTGEDAFDITGLTATVPDTAAVDVAITKTAVSKADQNNAARSPVPLSLIGNTYFSVTAKNAGAGDVITDLKKNPAVLHFDINAVPVSDRYNLRVAWHNSAQNIWEIIPGQKLTGEALEITITHLSDFALADRLPVGQILETTIACNGQWPYVSVKGWSYDPDNLSRGAADMHVYDKNFTQTDYRFLFTNQNAATYERGHDVALRDMAMLRLGKDEPYVPAEGAHYGFSIDKPLPSTYTAGASIDVNAYALNVDSYGNSVKRSSLLNRPSNVVFTLTVPDCGATTPAPTENIKPRGQLLSAGLSCVDGRRYLSAEGWAYDPNNLAYGVPTIHFYDGDFSKDTRAFLFTNKKMTPFPQGNTVALRDMSIAAVNKPAYRPAEGVQYGFSVTGIIPDSYQEGDVMDINAFAINIDANGVPVAGNFQLNRPAQTVTSLSVPPCETTPPEPPTENKKNSAAYHEREAWLVSDADWKTVLAMVPVVVWDGADTWCQRSAETATDVCAYPALIFHAEDNRFDADSIISFFQQYQPEKIVVVGTTPQALQDLLIAPPPLGTALANTQIQYFAPADVILNHWLSFNDIVYAADNYAAALVAAPYASLLNAPLVISGAAASVGNFKNKNIICVGAVGSQPIPQSACTVSYSAEQLQKIYAEKTKTDKLMLVNPDDLAIRFYQQMYTERGSQLIEKLYERNSLAAPFLAGAKHELVITSNSQDYSEIKQTVQKSVNEFMPQIINNNTGLSRNNLYEPSQKIFALPLSGGQVQDIAFSCDEPRLKVVNGKLVWWDCNHTYVYDAADKTTNRYKPGITTHSMYVDGTDTSAAYATYNNTNGRCYLYRDDFKSNQTIPLSNYVGICQPLKNSTSYVVWEKQSDVGMCYASGNICTGSVCEGMFCLLGKNACGSHADCGNGDYCIPDACFYDQRQLIIMDMPTRHILRTLDIDGLQEFDLSGNNLAWTVKNPDNSRDLYLYQINAGQREKFIDTGNINLVQSGGENILWSEKKNLYIYNIAAEEKKLLSSTALWQDVATKPSLSDDFVSWLDATGPQASRCEHSGEDCTQTGYCPSYCPNNSCLANRCIAGNVSYYNNETGQIKTVAVPRNSVSPIVLADNLFYAQPQNNVFYINGFLTVFGSSYAIPFRENIDAQPGYDNYRALDETEYADIYLNDRYPDVAVGRIHGISTADVSSYVARVLFQDTIPKTGRTLYALREGFGPPATANAWTAQLQAAGYDAACIMEATPGVSQPLCGEVLHDQWPPLWQNRDLIYYSDHGDVNWAGIYSSDMPDLNNAFVVGDACLTCSMHRYDSFCANVIRRGALGYLGAVSVAFSDNAIYGDTLNGMFHDNIAVGLAFARSFIYSDSRYMTIYIGDPTLNIKPLHLLPQPLPVAGSSLGQAFLGN